MKPILLDRLNDNGKGHNILQGKAAEKYLIVITNYYMYIFILRHMAQIRRYKIGSPL